jgi:hypothetical protein
VADGFSMQHAKRAGYKFIANNTVVSIDSKISDETRPNAALKLRTTLVNVNGFTV